MRQPHQTHDLSADPTTRSEVVRPWVLVVLIGELTLATAFTLFWSLGHDAWGFAAIGLICTVMIHAPFLSPRQKFLSMWGLVSLAVTIGAGIRGIMLATGYPSRQFVLDFFTRGEKFSELFHASVVTLFSIGALVAGYLLTQMDGRVPSDPRSRAHRIWVLRASQVSEPLVLVVSGVYALVGLYGTLSYTRHIGGLGVSIAQRRAGISADGATFETYGQFEYLAQAGTIGAVLLLAYWLTTRPRIGPLRMAVLLCSS